MGSEIVFSGKLFEIKQIVQPDGRVFERAVRAPGVRLIIADQAAKKLLLTKEYRSELKDWDYRLPGGKVFDSLAEYDAFREQADDIVQAAAQKAKAEGHEEAGIDISEVKLFKKSTLGATVEWDLYIFEVISWQQHKNGQNLEAGEEIDASNWFAYDKIKEMILAGYMQEERVALILLQWLTAKA